MADQVKLYGVWSSPFSCRVKWALKLKGIPYEYIEEDLPTKKSPDLLKYNPVHKKVPVLLHGGKPICESMIIVEYIEETWPEKYPLMPTDPHERATARFWVKFLDDKGPAIWMASQTTGEEQEKYKRECFEMMSVFNEYAGTSLGTKKFFGGDKIGILDIAFGWLAHWFEVLEQVAGVKLFEPNACPRLDEWCDNFKQVPEIKENLPDRDRMVPRFKGIRETSLGST